MIDEVPICESRGSILEIIAINMCLLIFTCVILGGPLKHMCLVCALVHHICEFIGPL